MVVDSHIQPGFVNGTLSSYAKGDIANERFKRSVTDSLNFVVRPEGSMQVRPGTQLIDNVTIDTVIINFNGGYVITIAPSSSKLRVYDALSGAMVQELTHTWTNIELHNLSYQQILNSIIFTNRTEIPKELARNPDTGVWTLANFDIKDGPYEVQNFSRDKRLQINAGIGSVTDGSTIYGTLYITGVNSAAGAGNFFTNDSEWVGRTLRFRSKTPNFERWVVLENLQYISANSMSGTVRKEYGLLVDGALPYGPTRNWQLSTWSALRGYPSIVGLDNNRLWFLDSIRRHGSVAGDLDSFSPSLPVPDDTSYVTSNDSAVALYSNNPVASEPQWLMPTGNGTILVGTDKGIEEIFGTNGAITPSTASIRPQSQIGACNIKPVMLDDVYYVDSTRTQIVKLGYQWSRARNIAEPITLLNSNMFRAKINDLKVVRVPFLMMWVSLDNGDFVVGTFDPKADRYIWSLQRLANSQKVRGFAVQDGVTVFAVTDNRLLRFGTFNVMSGATISTVNHQNSIPYQVIILDQPLEFYTDVASLYPPGSLDTTTLLTGQVAVDNHIYANYPKDTGVETIANEYEVGYTFDKYVTFNEVVNSVGSQSDMQSRKKVITASINLTESLDFNISLVSGTNKIPVKMRNPATPLISNPPVYTGWKHVDIGALAAKDRLPQFKISTEYSHPLCINGVNYSYEANAQDSN